MLQPQKDSVRQAFASTCALLEKKQAEIVVLRAKIKHDRSTVAIGMALTILFGAALALIGR